jgi:hypothetical protein
MWPKQVSEVAIRAEVGRTEARKYGQTVQDE